MSLSCCSYYSASRCPSPCRPQPCNPCSPCSTTTTCVPVDCCQPCPKKTRSVKISDFPLTSTGGGTSGSNNRIGSGSKGGRRDSANERGSRGGSGRSRRGGSGGRGRGRSPSRESSSDLKRGSSKTRRRSAQDIDDQSGTDGTEGGGGGTNSKSKKDKGRGGSGGVTGKGKGGRGKGSGKKKKRKKDSDESEGSGPGSSRDKSKQGGHFDKDGRGTEGNFGGGNQGNFGGGNQGNFGGGNQGGFGGGNNFGGYGSQGAFGGGSQGFLPPCARPWPPCAPQPQGPAYTPFGTGTPQPQGPGCTPFGPCTPRVPCSTPINFCPRCGSRFVLLDSPPNVSSCGLKCTPRNLSGNGIPSGRSGDLGQPQLLYGNAPGNISFLPNSQNSNVYEIQNIGNQQTRKCTSRNCRVCRPAPKPNAYNTNQEKKYTICSTCGNPKRIK